MEVSWDDLGDGGGGGFSVDDNMLIVIKWMIC